MTFKIWNDSDAGFKTKIEIDGERVEHCFSNLAITAGVKDAVKIELDMPIAEQLRSDKPARLVFPLADSRDLLIKHGWTPPADADV